MAKDPICNMEVDEKTDKHTSVYNGKTYYFCAHGCKKTFESNPEKYPNGNTCDSLHSGHCGCGC
ncbi:MAG: YHS domain-containing protein [Candidatus Bathyarchaeota archaeon]|jgi:YHS domain-containing protein